MWIAAFAMTGVVAASAITAFVHSRSRAVTPPRVQQVEVVQVTPPPVAVDVERPVTPAPAPEPSEPTPPPDAAVEAPSPPTDPARSTRRKAPPEPVPTGPVLTKKEAEEVLRPEVLACMKEHGVHYLITRIGNTRRGSSVPALGLTGLSVVDYQPTPGFAKTALGRCVARAASAVRAPAYGGNYIYFGLRNESIPDPLADAPARLDAKLAEQALAALDDEARDCATRSPAGSRPGEAVKILVSFAGATGEVLKVEPFYIDLKSAYGRCLSSVYRKATVGKFRRIDDQVLHRLAP